MDIDTLQRYLHAEVVAGGEDTVVVTQFQPTWTAGRHTKDVDIPDSTLPVIHTDRAGSATWHGPGQLVIYPVVKLKEPVDTVAWIRAVERGVLVYLKESCKLPVVRIEGRAGVWLQDPGIPDRKICAIGLKVAKGATLHGIALNVNIDMTSAFSGIIPCGLTDAGVTSLHAEGVRTTVGHVATGLLPVFLDSIDHCLARPGTERHRETSTLAHPQLPSNLPWVKDDE